MLVPMALLLNRLARFAAQKIAQNPQVREKAGDVARAVAQEAQAIAKEDDKARAAGRSVRRFLDGFNGER